VTELAALTEADFRANPALFVELAHVWAAEGTPPDPHHSVWLRNLTAPRIPHPAEACEALWGILASPERGRSLLWLDQTGLLAELIPAWGGRAERRAQRLLAVEEVHLERWAGGLESLVFEWLCVYQDQRAGRLSGWALAGLATLLLEGDVATTDFVTQVERDLTALGAYSSEREPLLRAIREYPDLRATLTSHGLSARNFSPTTVVAAMASALAAIEIPMPELRSILRRANYMLLRYAAPPTPKGREAS
jgi:hypothetical protein